jgi:alanine racemase
MPVMLFKGRVLQVRDLPVGTPVGYGRTFYTAGPLRIAILSAGYAEGLPRGMSNTGHVLIRGRRAPLVGRVSMNLTAADITGIPDVEKGDEVVFIGSQGGQILTADDIAKSAGTISYEIFCSIGLRNNKEYRT